ncbi:MAG: isoprenylcysteine carboxylmethyltransferase family protein, partial [Burkholderiales bacterium]
TGRRARRSAAAASLRCGRRTSWGPGSGEAQARSYRRRPSSVDPQQIGVAVGVAGVAAFRRARTTVDPRTPERARSVVRSGVFRVSRNPMYLGLALGLTGVAAWFATVPGLLLVPLFCLYITQFQIKPEERILLASFGQQYAAYMAQVRRWV